MKDAPGETSRGLFIGEFNEAKNRKTYSAGNGFGAVVFLRGVPQARYTRAYSDCDPVCFRCAFSHKYAGPGSDGFAGTYGNRFPDARIYKYSKPDGHKYTDPNGNKYSQAFTHKYTYTKTYGNALANKHSEAFAHKYSDTFTDSLSLQQGFLRRQELHRNLL